MPRHINDYDFSKLNDERLEKEIKEFVEQHSIITDGTSLEDLKERIIDKFEDKTLLSNMIEDFDEIIQLANRSEELIAQNMLLKDMLCSIFKYATIRPYNANVKQCFSDVSFNPVRFYEVDIIGHNRFLFSNLEGYSYLEDLQKELFSYCRKDES